MRGRSRPFSNRTRKLTEDEEIDLRVWYFSERTVAGKARELGISRRALLDYVFHKHKPRPPSLASHFEKLHMEQTRPE